MGKGARKQAATASEYAYRIVLCHHAGRGAGSNEINGFADGTSPRCTVCVELSRSCRVTSITTICGLGPWGSGALSAGSPRPCALLCRSLCCLPGSGGKTYLSYGTFKTCAHRTSWSLRRSCGEGMAVARHHCCAARMLHKPGWLAAISVMMLWTDCALAALRVCSCGLQRAR